ncbi:hypothetical protein JIQ42_01030 [Leishmania sp. Namibia]|uniref:hypothetical protein n=1 Tax=Leishmania sp. Namibia TaxID=2802991 RepID=UPI001B627B91|nr:hypothetical protein JIQ42_01030 [Leishmania sp. Namibia]
MRRLCSNALRCSSAGCVAHLAVPGVLPSPTVEVPRREGSSSVPPANESAEATRSPAEPLATGAALAAPDLDAKAAEQVRVARELGEQAFGENTEILKKVAARGLRAFLVCAVGMAAFMWAMKKRKQELMANATPAGSAADGALAEEEDGPTQRYLQEMRGLGFDVDTLEEELKLERLAKAAASQQGARRWLQ